MKKPVKITLLVLLAIVLYYLLVPKYYFVKDSKGKLLRANKITGHVSSVSKNPFLSY